MARILLIYTGGTVGSYKGPEGFTPYPHGEFEAALRAALAQGGPYPEFELHAMERLIDSSQAMIADWADIGRVIADRYADYDGFVVLHGTDTMDHAAANLAFMLENLDKPVVLSGSQKILAARLSDAARNVRSALHVVEEGKVREVSLCFNRTLLRGVRAFKYSAEHIDAFRSPNFPALARINFSPRDIERGLERIAYNPAIAPPSREGAFNFFEFDVGPVSVIDATPGKYGHHGHLGRSIRQAQHLIYIRGFGNGNIPESEETRAALRLQQKRGAVIVIGTHCPQARVDFRYAAGNWTTEFGAIPALDITEAALVAKLCYLAAKADYRPVDGMITAPPKPGELEKAEQIRKGLMQDLRGEITLG